METEAGIGDGAERKCSEGTRRAMRGAGSNRRAAEKGPCATDRQRDLITAAAHASVAVGRLSAVLIVEEAQGREIVAHSRFGSRHGHRCTG